MLLLFYDWIFSVFNKSPISTDTMTNCWYFQVTYLQYFEFWACINKLTKFCVRAKNWVLIKFCEIGHRGIIARGSLWALPRLYSNWILLAILNVCHVDKKWLVGCWSLMAYYYGLSLACGWSVDGTVSGH